jgi:hypothetical protein
MQVSSPGGMCCGSQAISSSIAAIGLGFAGLVLLGPALDLAREIIAGLAVVGQADRRVVDGVQRAITRFSSS